VRSCDPPQFGQEDKGMSSKGQKGEAKKMIILVWQLMNDFLAYAFDALWDVFHVPSTKDSSLTFHSVDQESCTHNDTENLWDGVDRSTDRWECMTCGKVFDEEDFFV